MSGGGAHLGGEEETVKWGGGGYFPPAVIKAEERGGLGRPLGSVTDTSIEPESATGSARRVPLLWVADMWTRGRYLKVVRPGLA
jgi:hypothetical protein